ncbi:MAG: CRISPR-associated endonuclease Cas2 [Spirochaetaceae bacterium 4572_59]|nr:MAG: CRISPR-associated endonuclease Cas2 [Spirochaetaceae bacterium 4572_59]
MKVVVSYDVRTDTPGGKKRLRRIAKLLESYGQRVQYSVFECEIDQGQWLKLKSRVIDEINQNEDSLRIYKLGNNWERKIEQIGVKKHYEMIKDVLIL